MLLGSTASAAIWCHAFQAVGASGETPGTDDLDAGAKRVNPEVTTISKALDDKARCLERLCFIVAHAKSRGQLVSKGF